jgi:hypothetical protein
MGTVEVSESAEFSKLRVQIPIASLDLSAALYSWSSLIRMSKAARSTRFALLRAAVSQTGVSAASCSRAQPAKFTPKL